MIREELLKRILVIDGAMGSMIQQYKLDEKDFRGERFKNHTHSQRGNNDILNITRPDVVREIHQAYLEAGADIIETNTFSSQSISMADYGMEDVCYELNLKGAQIAREVADKFTSLNKNKPRFVAGAIGPTTKMASMSQDVNDPGARAVTFDELTTAFYDQVRGLVDGGVDVLLIETITDTLITKAAIFAIKQYEKKVGKDLPIMISGTITDASGRTLSGQTVEAFLNSVAHANPLSIGLNCALGAKEMRPHIEELSQKAPYFISAYPNAGLPNEFGQYEETAHQTSHLVEDFIKSGFVNIVGGCCGTTPEHIKCIAKAAEKYSPRVIPTPEPYLRLSGLEAVNISPMSNFVNIGERTNITGSPKFAKLILSENYEEALQIARQQVDGGAQVIDVNLDEGMIDSKSVMTKFLNLIASEPDIAKLPIMIDSSKWEVIEAGLKCIQGKGIVNSISLKEGEEKFIEYAKKIKDYGAAVVVMAFDEKGQADNYQKRIDICQRSYDVLVNKVNFPPQDIIFDPNVLTIATGLDEHNNYAIDFIEATRWIKNNLPLAKVSGGISNISFSFRGNNTVREAMHSVFLYYAIEAGLDMGIVNAGMIEVYDQIPKDLLEHVENVILNKSPEATEKLIQFAETVKNKGKEIVKDESWRHLEIDEKLSHALIKGIADYLENDIEEALAKYKNPLEIIEGPLMAGMNHVGELFGAGKMFLPQVVKSARVMKKAVAFLLPHLESQKTNTSSSKSGKILLATVKGDVHDIGKNIVGVVLACNNYEVIDLGVMVPPNVILEEAKKQNVDIIGLSGLITPSLDEMIHFAKELEREGLNIPLMIGGATTSKIHTAVKIDPCYSGTVVHVLDAGKSASTCSSLLNAQRDSFQKQIKKEYQELRENHLRKNQVKTLIGIEDARKQKPTFNFDSSTITKPTFLGTKTFNKISLESLVDYIDWSPFFHTWEMKGLYPRILEDKVYGKEATKLHKDALELMKKVIKDKSLQANAIIGFWAANSVGDDIELYTDDSRTKVLSTIHTIRQQIEKPKGEAYYALSDYIAPKSSGLADYFGGFAVSAGFGCDELVEQFKKEHDDYNGIMIKALADRFAEALAEKMHEEVRKNWWGYASSENLDAQSRIEEKYIGIRPAPGYPACPDHTEKTILFDLLNATSETGIVLSENMAMHPAAAVSGFYFAHPQSRYFGVGKIGKDQISDYAARKNKSVEEIEKWLSPNLGY